MEMQFGCVGFGLGYKKLSFGLANMVRLKIRHGLYDDKIIKLQINDMLCVGGRSGSSLVISAFLTEWFWLNADPKSNNWVYNMPSLINHKAELIATGFTAGNRLTSKVSVNLSPPAVRHGIQARPGRYSVAARRDIRTAL